MTFRILLAVVVLGTASTFSTAEPPIDRKQLKSGLVTSYVRDPEHAMNASKMRLEPTVALLLQPGQTMHPGQSSEAYATWTGTIQIISPGEYTFSANLQSGNATVVMTLDGKTFEMLKASATAEKSETVKGTPTKLDPGVYRFNATFESHAGSEKQTRRLELLWEGPGFRREPVPWFFFGHIADQVPPKFAYDNRLDHGRYLFEELACINCHRPATNDAAAKTLIERNGPDLSQIGSRAFPGWIDAWLADPTKLRPHTTMPKMFAETDAGIAERYAVTQYLVSMGGPLQEVKASILDKNYQKSLDTGKALFITTGCAACHGQKLAGTMKANDDDIEPPPLVPQDSIYGLGTATGAQSRYALGGIGTKTTADALARYLRNPLFTNPHGRMPDMNLSNDEARDIARHLMRQTEESIKDKLTMKPPAITADALAKTILKDGDVTAFAKLKPNDQWKDLGKRIFTSKGCVNCHTMTEDGKKLPPNATFKEFELIRSKQGNHGCLSDTPVSVKYTLAAAQKQALREFLPMAHAGTPSPAYQTRAALKRFNCLNCHSKDGEGGLGSELADTMKKLESAANEDDVQPPRLTGIGHKSTTAWLQNVLLKGERARPWMTLRMPQYGEPNVGTMPAGLAACEGMLTDTTAVKPKPTAKQIDDGRKLAGKDGLGCVACHDISGYVGGGTRGPDLAMTDSRVRQEWYGRWMHNPQRLAPGTKMPSNFTDGKSVNTLLGSDADAQIAALWAYFSLGQGLPLPTGLEPPGKGMPLLVKDRPEVMRTFMPGDAGTRPIAVGYPGGTGSYVFDSHAARVVYAWEGNFLDVSPVWGQRGGNAAKLLGPKYLTAPNGNPWAVTNDATPPDFLKRAEDYAYGLPVPFQNIYAGPMRVHFNGYSLDTAGRPTFKYKVDSADGAYSVGVDDTPVPVKAAVASGLKRTMVVERPATKTVWLLVGSSTKKARLIGNRVVLPQEKDRALLVTVGTLPKGATWEFLPSGDGQLAVLKFPPLPTNEKSPLEFTVWSVPRDDESLFDAVETAK